MKRVGRMLLGYVAASYAAAFAGSVCFTIVFMFVSDGGSAGLSLPMIMTPIVGTVILLVAALPSILVLFWLEKRKVTDRTSYVIGGALVGLICVAMLALLSGPDFASSTAQRLTTVATTTIVTSVTGAIAGFVYRWIAVWNAGQGRKSDVDPAVFD